MASTVSHGVKTLGVVGAGQMGLGIAYVAALRAQIPSVLLCDASPVALDKGVSFFESLLKKDVSKGKIQQADADAARARLVIVSKLEDFAAGSASKRTGGSGDGAAADMVIEAATENLSIKQKIFGTLASSLPLETILATNTSSISVSKIAASAVPADCKPGSEAAWKSPARVSRVRVVLWDLILIASFFSIGPRHPLFQPSASYAAGRIDSSPADVF